MKSSSSIFSNYKTMKQEINYMKKNWEKHKHAEGNSVISTESSKCAFAETKAKFYEKSSLHSDQKRIKKENKKKREAKIQQYKVPN